MKNSTFFPDQKEIAFVLNEVLRVNVLTKSKTFSAFDEKFFDFSIRDGIHFAQTVTAPLNAIGDEQGVEEKKGGITTPSEFQSAWKTYCKSNRLGQEFPLDLGGKDLPQTIGVALHEILFTANPAFALYVVFTEVAAKIVTQYGSKQLAKDYGEKMLSGECAGTMCFTENEADSDLENVSVSAIKEREHYLISGKKSFIIGGDQDLTANIAHLVLAQNPNVSDEKCLSLFLVPKFRIEKQDKLVHNNVTVSKLNRKMGLHGTAVCDLDFGKSGECRGYLLGKESRGMELVAAFMDAIRLKIVAQCVGQSANAFKITMGFFRQQQGASIQMTEAKAKKSVSIINHPGGADNLMYLKAMTEALRGFFYATAFYADCERITIPEKKEYFQSLKDIHLAVIKAYASEEAMECLRKAMRIVGSVGYLKETGLEQSLRDVMATQYYETSNGMQAVTFVTDKILANEGRMVQNLVEEFNIVNDSAAQSEGLRETIGVWRDYIGGLIIVADDLKNLIAESGPRLAVLNAEKTLHLFGDIIACFHLIRQALAAEAKLRDMGFDMTEVFETAQSNEEVQYLYNKLLTVEYFALNILPRQEGYIRILQRNCSAALDTSWD